MTVEMHAYLADLCARYHTGELTQEEDALAQIHAAYCDTCREVMARYETASSEDKSALQSVSGIAEDSLD
jgi:hypothetical protein